MDVVYLPEPDDDAAITIDQQEIKQAIKPFAMTQLGSNITDITEYCEITPKAPALRDRSQLQQIYEQLGIAIDSLNKRPRRGHRAFGA